ncbi:MAG: class I SAM-dependent methyltransferase [Patescibacteria group bacterium]|nr:class I SAM-dependent methyltransferase [Patescibacteria group bacterium]
MNKHSQQNKTFFTKWNMDLRESRFKRIIELLVGEKPGKILDVGCSSGDFVAGFADLGWEPFGLEISNQKVAEAKKKGVNCQVGDVSEELPFKDNTFKAIIAGEIIEHLVDTDAFIKELHRILKKDGVVIITTPNLASLENRVRLLFGKYPRWVDYKIESYGHVRSYTPKALKRHLTDNGFKVEAHTGNFIPPLSQEIGDDVKWPWLAKTGKIFPSLAMDIIMKARKP